MDKGSIRKHIKHLKSLLSETEKHEFSKAVFFKIEQLPIFKTAQRVLLYNSLPDELPTKDVIDRWGLSKQIFLPRVNGLELEILPYLNGQLSVGAYNIEEPTGNDIYDINAIDTIIVPAVAFDPSGNRVGRGKGYYDKLLARTDALKIGVVYDFQIVDTINSEPHDIKMDIIVSPQQTIIINTKLQSI